MRKHTKHITTKKIQRLQTIDKLVWLIPPIIFLYMIIMAGPSELISSFSSSLEMGILFIVLVLTGIGVSYIPLMMIWHAISHTMWKSAVKDASFPVFQDFDYYRDELEGISPAVISMCTDLEIETQKDITAQILSYSLKGIVDLSGNTVQVMNIDDPSLSLSDKYLLGMLKCGRLNDSVAQQWAAMAKSEIVGGEFIKTKSKRFNFPQNSTPQNDYQAYVPGVAPPKPKKDTSGCGQLFGCSMGCLPLIVVSFLITAFSGTAMYSSLTNFLDNADINTANEDFLQELLSSPDNTIALMIVIVLSLLAIAALTQPIAMVVRAVTGAKVASPYERTKAGEVLTEEIYGLKNFIRDFSALSDAQKEQLVLWDDFLVYAVVLEENDIVVREILQMRNIKLYEVHF